MSYKNLFFLFLGAVILISAQGCKPVVVVEPTSLDFGNLETQKTFQVWNKSDSTSMDFQITKSDNWMTVNPEAGTSKGPSDKKNDNCYCIPQWIATGKLHRNINR